MNNREIVIPEPGKVIVRDCPMPERKSGEVLLKVLYGGICGSDLGTYRGSYAMVDYPRIPGHELACEVVDLDDAVDGAIDDGGVDDGLKKGALATVNPYSTCGHCYPCERGLDGCCVDNKTLGCARDGGFARFITVPRNKVYAVEGLGEREAATIEPFCVSWHGVGRGRVAQGEKALVIGAGAIGILAFLAARRRGAEVYVTDISRAKLERAKELGAAGVFENVSPEALREWSANATAGRGFPVVIEAVGLPATFQSAVDVVSTSGRVVEIGISKYPLKEFALNILNRKELDILGSRNASKNDFMEVMAMMRETGFRAETIVTNVYDFEDAPKAWEDFDQNADTMLKILLKF